MRRERDRNGLCGTSTSKFKERGGEESVEEMNTEGNKSLGREGSDLSK